jgi:hypothetical protein
MPIEDVHAKIHALLELSKNNPSEEEAARAAEMARKMMMKWNIEENELKTRSSVNYGDPTTSTVTISGRWRTSSKRRRAPRSSIAAMKLSASSAVG